MKTINNYGLFTTNDNLLVACSGGVDSVVLCHALIKEGHRIELAHCNFHLRGEESNRDAAFVKLLSEQWQVKFHTIDFDTIGYAEQHKLSIQLAARAMRYEWFQSILESNSHLKFIVTAHNANDNAETAAMNFFKGTGISGLHGILPVNGQIVRPILHWRREEIVKYASEHNIVWVDDSSNEKTKYTRNFFRHVVFAEVEKHFENAIGNVNKTIDHLRAVEQLYKAQIETYKSQLMVKRDNGFSLDIASLQNIVAPQTVLYEMLKDYGFQSNQIPLVMDLLDAQVGKSVASDDFVIVKDRGVLLLAENDLPAFTPIEFEKTAKEIIYPGGKLTLELMDNGENVNFSYHKHIAYIDADKIIGLLSIRPWQNGDHFYPLGMTLKKKIARFLIDAKVSMVDKRQTMVLTHNNQIAWLINHRLDNRYKLTNNSKKVLKITFKYIK